jgi:uncharacterized membrane protein YkoI
MNRTLKLTFAAGAIALAAGGIGTAAVGAASTADQSEKDLAITGAALQHASRAALAHTGGGRVSGTEVGDEESYYEVEVTLADGTQVDVQLDLGFHVVGSSADHEERHVDNEGS